MKKSSTEKQDPVHGWRRGDRCVVLLTAEKPAATKISLTYCWVWRRTDSGDVFSLAISGKEQNKVVDMFIEQLSNEALIY